MNTATATFVGADIDAQTWQRASAALAAMGMTAADAIRLTMSRIAEEGRMPFVSRAPAAQEGGGQENCHEEVLAIGRRNGVTREDVEALMQKDNEAVAPEVTGRGAAPLTGAQIAQALHAIGRELALTDKDFAAMEYAIRVVEQQPEAAVFEE